MPTLKKLDRSHTSNLTAHLKFLEKKKKNSQLKGVDGKKITMPRAEINKIETNKQEKQSKESIKYRNYENGKTGVIITNTKEIPRIKKPDFKGLFFTKLKNLIEMDHFLDTYHLPKSNQDQIL